MTAEKPGRVNRSPDPSPHFQAAMMDTQNDDKIYTNFNVKNFTSSASAGAGETNTVDANAVDYIINEIEKEFQTTRKSIAILNKNLHELIILLKENKKIIDREQQIMMRLGPSYSSSYSSYSPSHR